MNRLIVKILRYLSAQDLLSLSLVSHAFHQFANWDELWRQLCYDQWEGDFEYKHNWKITTFFPRSDRFNPKLTTPIRIDGKNVLTVTRSQNLLLKTMFL
jgi:hypothetical protein